MKNFFLWVVVYIPALINILGTIAYYLGFLDGLIARYAIDVEAIREQCILW